MELYQNSSSQTFFLAPSFLVCFRELLYKINIKSLPSAKLFSRASFIFNGEAALAALNEAYHLYADRPILTTLHTHTALRGLTWNARNVPGDAYFLVTCPDRTGDGCHKPGPALSLGKKISPSGTVTGYRGRLFSLRYSRYKKNLMCMTIKSLIRFISQNSAGFWSYSLRSKL